MELDIQALELLPETDSITGLYPCLKPATSPCRTETR